MEDYALDVNMITNNEETSNQANWSHFIGCMLIKISEAQSTITFYDIIQIFKNKL